MGKFGGKEEVVIREIDIALEKQMTKEINSGTVSEGLGAVAASNVTSHLVKIVVGITLGAVCSLFILGVVVFYRRKKKQNQDFYEYAKELICRLTKEAKDHIDAMFNEISPKINVKFTAEQLLRETPEFKTIIESIVDYNYYLKNKDFDSVISAVTVELNKVKQQLCECELQENVLEKIEKLKYLSQCVQAQNDVLKSQKDFETIQQKLSSLCGVLNAISSKFSEAKAFLEGIPIRVDLEINFCGNLTKNAINKDEQLKSTIKDAGLLYKAISAIHDEFVSAHKNVKKLLSSINAVFVEISELEVEINDKQEHATNAFVGGDDELGPGLTKKGK